MHERAKVPVLGHVIHGLTSSNDGVERSQECGVQTSVTINMNMNIDCDSPGFTWRYKS